MSNKAISNEPDIFDDDDEGWEDMPVVRESDEFAMGLDEEDQKKYHYTPTAKKDIHAPTTASNATGIVSDVDNRGVEWRSKLDQNENEYTRLRLDEEDDADEVHLRTKYLFDEDKAMTPLSQMQATKNLLTEAQRIAYVGLCALTSREMAEKLKRVGTKEMKPAVQSMELWALKIMGRLYYHMELATEEQKMIDSLAMHGVRPEDLVPSLMTTHTVANPEYDPVEARRQADELKDRPQPDHHEEEDDVAEHSQTISVQHDPTMVPLPKSPNPSQFFQPSHSRTVSQFQTTARVLEDSSTAPLPGVTTSLSNADKDVTLDIRWTVLCDLFLTIVADSVYDARSRVLLEQVAIKLGLGWLDVVKFEKRVTDALEIQEGVEKMEQKDVIEGRQKLAKRKRYVMMGLATLGGGLVIGLSAGLLAPVIGAGLGAAFTTIGIGGTTGFLAGTGGAAVITTGGVLTGGGIAAKGMAKRTQQVRTFEMLPLHNNKRVNCILTVPGFMTSAQDDVRLPFSVLDPIVGDVFSVLWEPEMIVETGSALKIMTTEVLSQIGQTVLQATVMTGLMTALQWPIILTKLGYLIDNPWNNALDRAKAAGSVLADVLIQRHLGVRPITLIGFSLGARVIFYALLELARHKAYGIVQDVFILGTTVTAPVRTWNEARSAVSGRFVNAYARNDWVLNYLFRATSGGLNTVAGLRPIEGVAGLENVDVTDKIAGHMSYRAFMPLILDQLGFPVFADYFDEPEEPDFQGDRVVIREGEEVNNKSSWFARRRKSSAPPPRVSRPPSAASFNSLQKKQPQSPIPPINEDDDLPPREESSKAATSTPPPRASIDSTEAPSRRSSEDGGSTSHLPPKHAGFNLDAIKDVIGKAEMNPEELEVPPVSATRFAAPPVHPPTHRTESAPPPLPVKGEVRSPSYRASSLEASAMGQDGIRTLSSARDELPSAFARSTSMGSSHPPDQEDGLTSYAQSSSSSRFASLTSALGSRPPPAPTLSFGGFDGSVWAPEPDPLAADVFRSRNLSSNSQTLYSRPSFGASSPRTDTTSLSFGGADGSIVPAVGYGHNPFAGSTASLAGGGSGSESLSFGGLDGSITMRSPSNPSLALPGTDRDRDDWKKSAALYPNPWQS